MDTMRENDMFTLKSGKYITLSKVKYFDNDYIFTNKLDKNEEPTDSYVVFRITNEGLIEEKDKDVLGPLLEYFTEFVNNKLELVNMTLKGGEHNG